MPGDELMIRAERIEQSILLLCGRACGETERRLVSAGFHVSTDQARVRQLEITNCDFKWGGARARPYGFTELGLAMLSSVLKSARAVGVTKAALVSPRLDLW